MIGTSSPKLVGQTILIVDDTPANLAVAVDHLEAHGFLVRVAQDGKEALERARFILPDLILLDVMMPGIDGFETCRRLKAMETTRDIPVIFMTALTDTNDKLAAFAAGGADYVTKPFDVEELLARVEAHLALRAAQRQLAARNIQLQASETRYRRLFETAGDGILLLDFATGQVIDANASLCAMLGYDRAELVGRTLWALDPFRDVPSCPRTLEELQAKDFVRDEHWELRTARGRTINIEMAINVYQVDTAKVIHCNIRDITERTLAHARIRHMALHDALTGLPNRVLLEDRLEHFIARARRSGKRVAVLMLDLDHFKHINDSLGHHVGDRLLEDVANRLRTCLRESDIVARLGGDEFVIGLPELADGKEASAVAEKALKVLLEPFLVADHHLHVGGSIGIALYPADGGDAGALVRAADTAMYDAKEKGRSTFRFFTPALNEAAQRRLALTSDLRHACARGEFQLHYQPQVSTTSAAITGVEALLRWNHPKEGLISPLNFVPLLEEMGLIVEVGEWVLQTACRQNVKWQAEGLPPVRMAVNLSSQQFYRGEIVHTVEQALRESGLDPQWLELELTESLTLDDTEITIQIMHDLKRLGVSLSLDDFGTGWSSLSYLRRFPLNRIKIDRSFMRDVVSHPSASAVVRSIMTLAQELGLDCIAEGVETAEQLSYLQTQSCGEIQGFLFSPGLPASEAGALMRSTRRLDIVAPPTELHVA